MLQEFLKLVCYLTRYIIADVMGIEIDGCYSDDVILTGIRIFQNENNLQNKIISSNW